MAYILYKHDGIIEKLDNSSANVTDLKKSFTVSRGRDGKLFSPCVNCDNCYADKCQKIADRDFRMIDEYSFINHGFEIVDDNGIATDIYIDVCDNFVKDHPRLKIVPTVLSEPKVRVFKFGVSESEKVLKKVR